MMNNLYTFYPKKNNKNKKPQEKKLWKPQKIESQFIEN